MRLELLPLGNAYLLVPGPEYDTRGFLARCFSRAQLQAQGLVTAFPEWSLSFNARAGTLRGLHWQAEPRSETKLVQCIRGKVCDVITDMRPGAPTRGKWHAVELSEENRHGLYSPAGFAHGFQTLCHGCELLYHVSAAYDPKAARGVRFDDPDIAIAWPPVSERIISERDASLPHLRDIASLR